MCNLRPDLCPHPLSENTYDESKGITHPCVFCHEEQAQEDGFCSEACRAMMMECEAVLLDKSCAFCHEEQAQEDGFCSEACRSMMAEEDCLAYEIACPADWEDE